MPSLYLYGSDWVVLFDGWEFAVIASPCRGYRPLHAHSPRLFARRDYYPAPSLCGVLLFAPSMCFPIVLAHLSQKLLVTLPVKTNDSEERVFPVLFTTFFPGPQRLSRARYQFPVPLRINSLLGGPSLFVRRSFPILFIFEAPNDSMAKVWSSTLPPQYPRVVLPVHYIPLRVYDADYLPFGPVPAAQSTRPLSPAVGMTDSEESE